MTTDPQKIYEELKRRQADIFAGVGIGAEPNVKRLLADNIPIPRYPKGVLFVPKGTSEEFVEYLFKSHAGFFPITVEQRKNMIYPEA